MTLIFIRMGAFALPKPAGRRSAFRMLKITLAQLTCANIAETAKSEQLAI